VKVLKRYSGIGGGIQMPNRLIIHSMSEWFEIDGKKMYADEFLKSVKLSAHFLLCPNGDFIKLRKTHEIAYHAKGHNTNTIGIEVLVEGVHTYETFLSRIKEDWVTPVQMEELIGMSKGIMDYYDISIENVLRHSDIDYPRKVDPGNLDWEYFKSKLKGD
jgi:N-acetyl-anhydromuramyl-L-alanine amidase AmpD